MMESITKRLLFTLLLLLSYQVGFAQNLKAKIDNIATAHFRDTTNVGLSIGIIQNGIASDYYFGGKYTNLLKDIDSTTLFEIGSVSKIYTSFIFASLENEKKISRFDLLSKYLPKDVTKGKKWASQIRLVDLATHTSGLPGFENTKSLMGLKGFDENDPYGIFTEQFMLSILKETDALNDYGKVSYSNFGIGLLTYAMAKAEKTSFDNLFKKYITTRQKLPSTYLKVTEQNLTSIAVPHRKLEPMPLIQLAELSPAGSIKSTMPDLLKFLNLHLQPSGSLTYVVETVLTNHLQGGDQEVGLGWGIYKIKNETVYFHNGGTYGSSSIVIIIPSKNSAVAILANNSTESELTGYALKIANNLIE
jgi:CubicO group peptidase (beta-lactamase class C family)